MKTMETSRLLLMRMMRVRDFFLPGLLFHQGWGLRFQLGILGMCLGGCSPFLSDTSANRLK